MKIPEYQAYAEPQVSLLTSYVKFIGAHELPERTEIDQYNSQSARGVALDIGRSCMMALHGNVRTANRSFKDIAERTAAYTINPADAEQRKLGQYHRLSVMLQHARDPDVVREQRQLLHEDIVTEAAGALDAASETWEKVTDSYPVIPLPLEGRQQINVAAGQVAEPTVTALMTRLNHPWMLAVPALVHHDKRQDRRTYGGEENYDTLLIETGPRQATANVRTLQTKLRCIKACEPEGQHQLWALPQQAYREDIQLVSGHCDLNMYKDNTGEWVSPLTDLLIKEIDETITDEEIGTLDAATGALLLNLTAELGDRRGHLPSLRSINKPAVDSQAM